MVEIAKAEARERGITTARQAGNNSMNWFLSLLIFHLQQFQHNRLLLKWGGWFS